jgi:hypothetical protein
MFYIGDREEGDVNTEIKCLCPDTTSTNGNAFRFDGPQERETAMQHMTDTGYIPSEPLQVPIELRRLSKGRAAGFRALLQAVPPRERRLGQIWSTKPASNESYEREWELMTRLVVILTKMDSWDHESEEGLIAMPISLDTEYTGPGDLTVLAEESPLGYHFMIEAWNEITMLEKQLDRYVGDLQQPAKRFLGLVYQDHLGIPVDLSELDDRLGAAILSESDPRVAFRAREIEAVDFLRAPALALVADPIDENEEVYVIYTVGDLVRAYTEELVGVMPTSGLMDLQADPTPVTKLLDAEYRVATLASIMTRANVVGGELRQALLGKIMDIVSSLTVNEPQGGKVYARRQRGRN